MATLKFHGHACFSIFNDDVHLIIDPWLSGNPDIGKIPDDLRPPTHILVTHNHNDHVGDAVALSKQFDAPIISTPSAARHYRGEGATMDRLHIGGRMPIPGGSIKGTPAFHDSPLAIGENWRVELGAPCGFVVTLDGVSVYHAGDTALFGDMALYGPVDVALLPIDGRMVMEPVDAVRAAEFLDAALTIPMHWRSQDPAAFVKLVEASGRRGRVLERNEELPLTARA